MSEKGPTDGEAGGYESDVAATHDAGAGLPATGGPLIVVRRDRPLSPHLQVYRPQITSVLSIFHRMAGVVLWLAALLLTYWLAAAVYGADAFATAQALFGSWFGRLVLFGLTVALFYHLCNGIRHLAWDAGQGFEMQTLTKSGIAVIVVSLVLTGLTWVAAYAAAGAW